MKQLNSTQVSVKKLINPNAVQEGNLIEARFPNGEIERGVAVREAKSAGYRNKRRMMLCTDGAKRGHIITGCAGFPDGTKFFRVMATPGAEDNPLTWNGEERVRSL